MLFGVALRRRCCPIAPAARHRVSGAHNTQLILFIYFIHKSPNYFTRTRAHIYIHDTNTHASVPRHALFDANELFALFFIFVVFVVFVVVETASNSVSSAEKKWKKKKRRIDRAFSVVVVAL